MKLQSFQNTGFEFSLMFTNGETIIVNLKSLIGDYVSENDLASAQVDSEWGCLEFCNSTVDIDPTTLYLHAVNHCDSGHHREARRLGRGLRRPSIRVVAQ